MASPTTLAELRQAIAAARREGGAISVAGGRHAMGGQQFGAGTTLIDTSALDRILSLDERRGIATVEAGIRWPTLMADLERLQKSRPDAWGIVQKQTGADRLSLGGALAANVHGRGLRLGPFVADVESCMIADAEGLVRVCSRQEHGDLFRLVAGGYGLFGIVYAIALRLARRHKVERRVEVRTVHGLIDALDERIRGGFEYGDFQFATDAGSDAFLQKGVFSCYRPVADDTPIPASQKGLSADEWRRLTWLAHHDKQGAFDMYAAHYLATDGQVYWSDTHQLAEYVDDYHLALDRTSRSAHKATEMISEVYVPRPALEGFLATLRREFRRLGADVIYGTIRLIDRDDESFLAWAREPWACIVVNLHPSIRPAGWNTRGRHSAA